MMWGEVKRECMACIQGGKWNMFLQPPRERYHTGIKSKEGGDDWYRFEKHPRITMPGAYAVFGVDVRRFLSYCAGISIPIVLYKKKKRKKKNQNWKLDGGSNEDGGGANEPRDANEEQADGICAGEDGGGRRGPAGTLRGSGGGDARAHLGRRRGRVVVGLNVGVREGLVQTRDDRLDLERGATCEGVWNDVAGGNINGLLEEVVLENDEACAERADVAKDILPVEKDLAGASFSAVDVEIVSIECSEG